MSDQEAVWAALERLTPEEEGNPNYQGLRQTVFQGGRLTCRASGLFFDLDLSEVGLAELRRGYDEQGAATALRQALADWPGFREFAWYSPFLLGWRRPLTEGEDPVDWTGQEPGSARDAVLRLRLATLLLLVLEGREGYDETRRLLRRQRFLLLTEMRDARYVRNPEGQVRAAQRAWATGFLERPGETALLLEQHGCELEAEARWLVWPGGEARGAPWDFATERLRDRAFSRRLARRWFLRRHDLPTTARLVGALATAKGQRGRSLARLFFGRWPGQVWAYPMLPAGLLLAALLLVYWQPAAQGWAACLVTASFCLTGALLLALGAGLLSWGPMALYPFALRLTAGITVGLIAWLALPDLVHEFAAGAFQADQWGYGVLLTLTALGGAFLYLFVEVYNVVEEVRPALARAGRILASGYAQALGLTAVMAALGANRLLPVPDCGVAGACVELRLGSIPVDYTLFTSALAMAVGVFVQILWEDKAITEPL